MSSLRNLVNRDELRSALAKDTTPRVTVSFYRYVSLLDPVSLRDELYVAWNALGVLGRIYLAEEGFNAQLCVPEDQWDAFCEDLESRSAFSGLRLNIAREQGFSFYKLTLKVKRNIVADGLEKNAYDIRNTGKHLNAHEVHELLDQDDTVVIDMRNHYESRIGRFEKAWCPDVDTFREQLPLVKEKLAGKEEKPVLMYCTGGIRCEKASAYLKSQGFKHVHQVNGGIIHYHKQCEEEGLESKFKGKNFVFDERGAEVITDDILSTCDQCDAVCDSFVNCKNASCNLLFIQCSSCAAKHEGCCGDDCKDIIRLSPQEYREYRKKVGAAKKNGGYTGRIRPNLKDVVACGCV